MMASESTEQQQPVSRLQVGYWLVTTVMGGAIIMCLELLGFRLYAPYIGYSIYIWGTMIAAVMVALAVGYPLGGYLADRSKSDVPMYACILFSGLYQIGILFVAHPLLKIVVPWGPFTATTLATLVIFVPPLLALAAIGPYIIRLLARMGHVGTTAGQVFALSTIGSVVGTLGTVFFLLPTFGTRVTMGIACVATVLLACGGLLFRRNPLTVSVILLLAVPQGMGDPWQAGALFARDSAYNLVRVVEEDGERRLILNDGNSIQSSIKINSSSWRTQRYFDVFALAPLMVEAENALLLGMGAGAGVHVLRASQPDLIIDAVEIDPVVVQVAKDFFDIQESEKLTIFIEDARPWLEHTERLYDIIQIDLYHGGHYIPFYLTTVEFFELVQDHLSMEGVFMMNVLDLGSRLEMLDATVATLETVFPSVFVMSGGVNHIVVAYNRDISLAQQRNALIALKPTAEFEWLTSWAVNNIYTFETTDDARIFTDDHAPVEPIVRRMLAEYERTQSGD